MFSVFFQYFFSFFSILFFLHGLHKFNRLCRQGKNICIQQLFFFFLFLIDCDNIKYNVHLIFKIIVHVKKKFVLLSQLMKQKSKTLNILSALTYFYQIKIKLFNFLSKLLFLSYISVTLFLFINICIV